MIRRKVMDQKEDYGLLYNCIFVGKVILQNKRNMIGSQEASSKPLMTCTDILTLLDAMNWNYIPNPRKLSKQLHTTSDLSPKYFLGYNLSGRCASNYNQCGPINLRHGSILWCIHIVFGSLPDKMALLLQMDTPNLSQPWVLVLFEATKPGMSDLITKRWRLHWIRRKKMRRERCGECSKMIGFCIKNALVSF